MLSRDVQRVLLAACIALGGCNDTQNLAPASPEKEWQVPASNAVGGAAAFQAPSPTGAAEINPKHVYSLTELIDIAMRRNQATRIAWEQARQAAINVGVASAAYLPALTASAFGGYERIALPFPTNLVQKGYITANVEEIYPTLAIRYLLLDFGGRAAAVESARQLSLAANFGFNSAHQKLILDVAHAYFALDGANAGLRAAQQALRDAETLRRSAEETYGRGLATIVTVQLARRDTAQARYDLSVATTAQHDATYGLLAAMELPPTTKLRVADASSRPLPNAGGAAVQQLLRDVLHRRPDLLAAVAKLRATDAGIALARSELLPKLSVAANVQENIGQFSVDGGPYAGVVQPQGGVFLRFDWPIYQGGLLENRLKLAESEHRAAEDALQERSNQALREVALAYDQLDTGLQQYKAAVALREAADVAFSAASDSYAQGIGTFDAAVSGETALTAARAALARAHAQSLINAAALAYATGAMSTGMFSPHGANAAP
jgi:outer membrane protein TolC